jgi:hypothetical protein
VTRERDEELDLPDDDLDEDLDEAPERGPGSFTGRVLGDFAKKAVMTGIGAVFMSEETLRNTLGDIKLPKEAMGYVVGQADKTKRELIAALSREMRSFLTGLELEKVIAKVLAGTTFEIHTRVKILPGDDGRMAIQILDTKTDITRGAAAKDEEDAAPEPAPPVVAAPVEAAPPKRRRPRPRRDRRADVEGEDPKE